MNPHVEHSPATSAAPAPPLDLDGVEELIIEDDAAVDSTFAEKLQRLLTSVLYLSWIVPGLGRTFAAFANVGLFRAKGERPQVPDVMVSLDVPPHRDLSRKENRTYIQWVIGKPPEVVMEFVSDRYGGERSTKPPYYAAARVRYYVVFDPEHYLTERELEVFELQADGTYEPLARPWLPELGLGLTLWEGEFERQHARWLRWCDADGRLLATPEEQRAEDQRRLDESKRQINEEKRRADDAEARAARLAEKLRTLGIDPDA